MKQFYLDTKYFEHIKGIALLKSFSFLTALVICFTASSTALYGQEKAGTDSSTHVVTIYVMKSIVPLHWDSPSSIYKSVRKGYIKELIHHKQFTLGHMAVKVESPVFENQGYSGMVSVSDKEKFRLFRKEKIGLAILGAPMQGKIASNDETLEKIKLYEKLGKIAFVRFLINREAAQRISLFMEGFNRASHGKLPPSSYYGGAFWPRYYGEGSGCTAYATAILDVAGLLSKEYSDWLIKILIPANLMGGEYNGYKKIRSKQILGAKSWASNFNDSASTAIPFQIFDNNPAYDWIMKRRQEIIDSSHTEYNLAAEGTIPGLLSDKRHVHFQPDEPIFLSRPDSSIFITNFRTEIK